MFNSSREKILQNIKNRLTNRVDRKNFNYKKIEFENRVEAFKLALKKAGGEIVNSTVGYDVVLKAEFGVAENGACFIKDVSNREDISYFETIVIKLDKDKIYNNMQEVMGKVEIDGYGIFLSGPSKTADIEQSLVFGAHGAKKVDVCLI